jgi:hypothetical protein
MRSRIYFSHALWLFGVYAFHITAAFIKGDFSNPWRISMMFLWAALIYVSCLNQLQRWEK